MVGHERLALLLETARKLRAHGSWAGETHVQKNMYLLQDLLGVPANFDFVLYHHGPFSFDLRDALFEMEAARLIAFQEQPYPYGPKITDGPAARLFRDTLTPEITSKIDFLAKWLGTAGAAPLERIATAFYIRNTENIPPSKWEQRLRELKPHIDEPNARSAFEQLARLETDARKAGFLPATARQA